MAEPFDDPVAPEPGDYAALARRIGDAARDARRCLDDLDDTPWPQMDTLYYQQAAGALDVVLRELLEAIEAVSALNREATLDRPLTDAEKEFVASAGMDPEAYDREAAEDWLVWSAITTDRERARLDRLTEMTALDILPGLCEVIDAFPDDFIDLDRFAVLRSPMEELGGLTVIQWLLLGGDRHTVASLIASLGCAP